LNYAFWSAHLEAAKFEEQSKTDTEPQSKKLDKSSEERQEDEEMEMLPQAVARGFQLENECVNMVTDEEIPQKVSQGTIQEQNDIQTEQHNDAALQDNDDAPPDSKPVKPDDDTACSDEEHINAAAIVDGATPDLQTEHETTPNYGRDETVPTKDNKLLTAAQMEALSSDSESSGGEADIVPQATPPVVASSSVELPVNPKAKLLTGDELLDLFKLLCSIKIKKKPDEPVVIGMVGYPNVGKSSTINTLIHGKKVPVSATPGRTKHFQVNYIGLQNYVSCREAWDVSGSLWSTPPLKPSELYTRTIGLFHFCRHFILMMMSFCVTVLDWCFHHLSPQRLRWFAQVFYQLIK